MGRAKLSFMTFFQMRALLLLGFLIAILLSACHEQSSTLIAKNRTIIIQPFSGIKHQDIKYIFKKLKRLYPDVKLAKTITLPSFCFYPPRNRYKANKIIHFLSVRSRSNEVTIGITNKDISTRMGNISDWGVMGLAFRPGKACVVSNFRLNKSSETKQLFKIAVHELGHTDGLPHCPVKTCFMRDAKGKNPTDEETGFCRKCKSILIYRGWTL